MSRATDSEGRVQRMAHDANYEGYVIDHAIPRYHNCPMLLSRRRPDLIRTGSENYRSQSL